MKIKIKTKEIKKYLDIETNELPKYVSTLINLANQYAQGTRPKSVGQMTELIHQFSGKTIEEWEQWYLKQKPDAIRNATHKILEMLNNFRRTIDKIDETLVEQWVRDLVVVKTYIGLKLQEAILKKGAELIGSNYRFAEPSDESKGIDGYIGETPVSIKPDSYESKAALPEQINAKMIFYRKVKNGIEVDYGELI